MTKRFLAGVVSGGSLLAATSLQAHHSLAGVCDLNKVERATGIVQRFAFSDATVGFLRPIVLPDKKEVEFVPTEAR